MARRHRIRKKLIKTLKGINGKKLLLYILFFGLALALWLVRALEETYTVDLSCKLYTSQIPPDIALSEPPAKELRVRVTDNGYHILQYQLRGDRRYLFLPLEFSSDRYGSIDIPPDVLENMAYSKIVSPSGRIERIIPSRVSLKYYPKAKRRLPIRLRTAIIPEVGSIIDSIILSHNSTIAYGGKQLLDTLTAAYTDSRRFEHIKDSTLLNVKLVAGKGVALTPSEISLRVLTKKLVQKVIEVPIQLRERESSYNIRLFPSTVKARCFIPDSRQEDLSEQDIVISIDYKALENSKEEKVPLLVLKRPSWVKMIEVDPPSVDFILEEK